MWKVAGECTKFDKSIKIKTPPEYTYISSHITFCIGWEARQSFMVDISYSTRVHICTRSASQGWTIGSVRAYGLAAVAYNSYTQMYVFISHVCVEAGFKYSSLSCYGDNYSLTITNKNWLIYVKLCVVKKYGGAVCIFLHKYHCISTTGWWEVVLYGWRMQQNFHKFKRVSNDNWAKRRFPKISQDFRWCIKVVSMEYALILLWLYDDIITSLYWKALSEIWRNSLRILWKGLRKWNEQAIIILHDVGRHFFKPSQGNFETLPDVSPSCDNICSNMCRTSPANSSSVFTTWKKRSISELPIAYTNLGTRESWETMF